MENMVYEGNLAVQERTEGINRALDDMNAGFKVIYRRIPKNNVVKDAFVMQTGSGKYNCLPTVYPDHDLLKRNDFEIAKCLYGIFRKNAKNVDLSAILTPSYIKDNVYVRLVNAGNIKALDEAGVICAPYLDLAVIFSIRVPDFEEAGMHASVKLTKELLKTTGMDIDEMMYYALENTGKDYQIRSMSEMIGEMTGCDMPEDDLQMPMWIVTNSEKLNAAALILCPGVLKELEKKLGSTFILLPSSIHETIAVKMGNGDDDRMLRDYMEIVRSVNESTVSTEDFLSNNIYICKNGKISVVE